MERFSLGNGRIKVLKNAGESSKRVIQKRKVCKEGIECPPISDICTPASPIYNTNAIANTPTASPTTDLTLTVVVVAAPLILKVLATFAGAVVLSLPNPGSGTPTGKLVFLNNLVGNIFGVAETWNCGATGAPSNWNKWSLYPCVWGSKKMRQDW